MRNRLIFLSAGLAIALTITVSAVIAGGGTYQVNEHALIGVNGPVTKSSKSWSVITGLGNMSPCLDTGGWSGDVGLTAKGGAFRVRMKVNGKVTDVAHFAPTKHNRSFSYPFSGVTDTGVGTFRVEWRSAKGDKVTVQSGAIDLMFDACP